MSKTQERLKRTFVEIKAYLGRAQHEGTLRDDKVVLEAARKIGIAIQLSGKGIQEAAQEGKFLDIIHYLQNAIAVTKVLNRLLNETIGRELRQAKELEPEDFL